MKKFKYSARDTSGKIVNGSMEAKDAGAVTDILHDRGLIIVNIKEAFGLENLAQLLYDNQWFKEEFKNSNEIVEWLKWWDNESKTY